MEQEAAKRMWARSVSRHQLRYIQMLSDGDSAAFREVVSLNPYPGHEVVKLECINHAHKRMGTALRKLSAERKLGGKGLGKFMAKKCKTLQNYYSMSCDEVPLHTRCNLSWCWHRRAEENGETPESHRLHAGNFLSREVGQKLIPVYHRMSSDSLLQRMQHGGTQNVNECLNSVIWARCPKTVFVGKSKVEAAASMAISTFNEGASAMLAIMDKLWLESTVITVTTIRESDMLRITKAESIQSESVKRCRKTLSTAKKLKMHQQERGEGSTYGAGMES
ncbi:unnamed protein product [Leuciscus chuanchicus]